MHRSRGAALLIPRSQVRSLPGPYEKSPQTGPLCLLNRRRPSEGVNESDNTSFACVWVPETRAPVSAADRLVEAEEQSACFERVRVERCVLGVYCLGGCPSPSGWSAVCSSFS